MVILGQQTMVILGGEDVVPVNPATTVVVAGSGDALDPATLPPAFGHGTMVAGIIHRVAPEARLMPLRAFDGSGRGNLVDIVEAIYYAVDHGANVINMSFSLGVFSTACGRCRMPTKKPCAPTCGDCARRSRSSRAAISRPCAGSATGFGRRSSASGRACRRHRREWMALARDIAQGRALP